MTVYQKATISLSKLLFADDIFLSCHKKKKKVDVFVWLVIFLKTKFICFTLLTTNRIILKSQIEWARRSRIGLRAPKNFNESLPIVTPGRPSVLTLWGFIY